MKEVYVTLSLNPSPRERDLPSLRSSVYVYAFVVFRSSGGRAGIAYNRAKIVKNPVTSTRAHIYIYGFFCVYLQIVTSLMKTYQK